MGTLQYSMINIKRQESLPLSSLSSTFDSHNSEDAASLFGLFYVYYLMHNSQISEEEDIDRFFLLALILLLKRPTTN